MAMVTLNRIIMVGLFSLTLAACSSSNVAPISDDWNQVDTTQTTHKVQSGETLYSIAWRYNISDENLIQWNHLQKPYYVQIGQVLRLTPPNDAATAAAPAPAATTEKIAAAPTFTPEATTAATKPAPVPTKATAQPKPKATAAKPSASPATSTAVVNKTAKTSTVAVEVPSGSWPWPVKGKVIAQYGDDGNKGIDITVAEKTPVHAVQSGTVVYAGNSLHGYGNLILIKHKGSADILTAYAHNNQLMVKEGSKVQAGQVIALSGHTEAKADMLHFEVRVNGKPVDPLKYLAKAPS